MALAILNNRTEGVRALLCWHPENGRPQARSDRERSDRGLPDGGERDNGLIEFY